LRYTHIRGEEGGDLSLFGSAVPSSSAPIKQQIKRSDVRIGYRYFQLPVFIGNKFCMGSYFSADKRTIQGIIGDDTKQ